jgi:signal transduction histidine kinase
MSKEVHILMVEDDAADAELIKYALRDGGIVFSLDRVDTERDFLHSLVQQTPDLILTDYALPLFDGFSALAIAQTKHPEIPFIFVTGTLGEEVVIETLKRGATDYVLKTRLTRLAPAVHRALQEADERAERKRAEAQLRESREQLRALSVYLQSVREEERTRIAREVHDELGQALTGLKMDLVWLGSKLSKDRKILQEKTKIMSAGIDGIIQTIRRIATELRPGVLDDLGLAAAIEWQAHEFQVRTGIQCSVTVAVNESPLDDHLNTAFFRIFQETLTNIMRHAQASRVEVQLKGEKDCLILEVKDYGRGISESEISGTKSLGLLGMRERAALLGGSFDITGIPGMGTCVKVMIPLKPATRNNLQRHEISYHRRPRSSTARLETHPRG